MMVRISLKGISLGVSTFGNDVTSRILFSSPVPLPLPVPLSAVRNMVVLAAVTKLDRVAVMVAVLVVVSDDDEDKEMY